MSAPRFPKMYCSKCGHSDHTTVCRFCSHDKLADLCARAAQKIAGDPPPLRQEKAA